MIESILNIHFLKDGKYQFIIPKIDNGLVCASVNVTLSDSLLKSNYLLLIFTFKPFRKTVFLEHMFLNYRKKLESSKLISYATYLRQESNMHEATLLNEFYFVLSLLTLTLCRYFFHFQNLFIDNFCFFFLLIIFNRYFFYHCYPFVGNYFLVQKCLCAYLTRSHLSYKVIIPTGLQLKS